MIDILIPVLGRPHRAAPLVENIRNVTEADHRIFFICSMGDHDQRQACLQSGADNVITLPYRAGHGDYAKKINSGFHLGLNYARTTGLSEWIFQAADDLTFQPGWDTAALQAAGDTFDVIATNDLANSSVKRGLFGTHNLIRRSYVTEEPIISDGLVLHEGYDHNFVDRELCGIAQKYGAFTFARHSHVQHKHPLWRTAPSDATYVKSLARFREDQQLFYSRAHLWDYHGLSAQERRMAA